MLDQKSVLAPAKRLTGGFAGAFYFGLFSLSVPGSSFRPPLAEPDASAYSGFICMSVRAAAKSRHDPHLHAESFWSVFCHSGAAASVP